jgi:WD40 repeat protein
MGHAQQVSEDPPTEPILRVETGPQHGAIINRIDTDAENRFAVTVSWDKTVRVWSLPDGWLKQAVRLPADLAKIGKAHAVAITPDGMKVAVGCCSGSRSHNNIFLFNRVSGELATRLSGVLHLAYSHDGKRLTASLEGANGIRVFDVGKGYRLLPSDTKYAKSSYWATFDRAGRLVTTLDDGFVRLYAVDHFAAPLHRFNLKDHEPYAAAFSPDGTRVAVGYYKPTTVVVLSGLNLTKLFEADTAGSGYDNLKAVAWSQDGRFLFAGGEWSGHSGWNQVRRWDKGGRGAVDIPVEDISIMEIVGLNSGSMLFLHEDGFGLIGPDTKVHQLQQSLSRLNLQSHGLGPLRVSADGSTVQVEAYQPRQVHRFALGKRQVDINPEADSALLGPITHDVPGLVVRNWKDSPLAGIFTSYEINVPQLYAELDRTKAMQLGIDVQDVFAAMQIYLGSLYINDFNKFGRTCQVIAQADRQFRSNPDDILRLQTRNAEGRMVPLGAVLRVSDTPGPESAMRYNAFRSADLNGGPAPGYSSGQAQQAITRILAETLLRGMAFEWTELTFQQQSWCSRSACCWCSSCSPRNTRAYSCRAGQGAVQGSNRILGAALFHTGLALGLSRRDEAGRRLRCARTAFRCELGMESWRLASTSCSYRR